MNPSPIIATHGDGFFGTWPGMLVPLVGPLYVVALFMAAMVMLDKPCDGRVPRGAVWIALAMPFGWLFIAARGLCAFLAVGLLPPERQPRPARRELEQRISQLERELEL